MTERWRPERGSVTSRDPRSPGRDGNQGLEVAAMPWNDGPADAPGAHRLVHEPEAPGAPAAAAGEAYWPQPSASPGLLRLESLPLADDLFLIMLDDTSGRLRVRPRIAGYALAGALLIELGDAGLVGLDGGRVWALGHRPPEDSLLRRLLGWIVGEAERTEICWWVENLAMVAVDEVSGRLVAGGWLRRQHRLGLTCRHVVFEPIDRNAVFWRGGRLTGALGRDPGWQDLTLVVLLDAVGAADQRVGHLGGPDTDQLRRRAVEVLPGVCPPAAGVCRQVQALAARAAISLR